VQWYGAKMERRSRERARWIATAGQGQTNARKTLMFMLRGSKEAPYWRAVAANFLAPWAGEQSVRTGLLECLSDERSLVREKAGAHWRQ